MFPCYIVDLARARVRYNPYTCILNTVYAGVWGQHQNTYSVTVLEPFWEYMHGIRANKRTSAFSSKIQLQMGSSVFIPFWILGRTIRTPTRTRTKTSPRETMQSGCLLAPCRRGPLSARDTSVLTPLPRAPRRHALLTHLLPHQPVAPWQFRRSVYYS